MKYIRQYLKDKKMYFFMLIFVCGVVTMVNYLYNVEIRAGIYALEVCMAVLLPVFGIDYIRFAKKHNDFLLWEQII